MIDYESGIMASSIKSSNISKVLRCADTLRGVEVSSHLNTLLFVVEGCFNLDNVQIEKEDKSVIYFFFQKWKISSGRSINRKN